MHKICDAVSGRNHTGREDEVDVIGLVTAQEVGDRRVHISPEPDTRGDPLVDREEDKNTLRGSLPHFLSKLHGTRAHS